LNTPRLHIDEYKKGILEGDRIVLAKAITLTESTLVADQQLAEALLDAVMTKTTSSLRVGITGAPGVGKSTFIEVFGKRLIESGRKLAVLTIDPTSQVTRGSILGDKTRMSELSKSPQAFIRPSPSGSTLGGVASHTREAILLCEAAGFDMIIVETVGTGQSEIAIRNMVDFFLLLVQPGSGDELQGIKKGIVEMADGIAITKADGNNLTAARATQADFQHALHVVKSQLSGWTPRVVTCSAVQLTGLPEIHKMIEDFQRQQTDSGNLQQHRSRQHAAWFRERFEHLLSLDLMTHQQVVEGMQDLNKLIQTGGISPRHAARALLEIYHKAVRDAG